MPPLRRHDRPDTPALEWAHVSGDVDSAAFILARKSQLAGDMQDPAEAVAVAEASMRLAGGRSRIGGVAATYASHGYGLAGERAACDRLCDNARESLDDAGGTGLPWAKFFDAAYIGVHHARSLAALGDYERAAEIFRSALNGLNGDYHRDRGVYLAREAAAYAGAGEADHAAGIALQALAVGAETRSGRIFTELGTVEQRLTPAASSPAVRAFTEALNSVVLDATKGTV